MMEIWWSKSSASCQWRAATDGGDAVLAAGGFMTVRYDRPVQGGLIRSEDRPPPLAAMQLIGMGAPKLSFRAIGDAVD